MKATNIMYSNINSISNSLMFLYLFSTYLSVLWTFLMIVNYFKIIEKQIHEVKKLIF